MIFYFSNHTLLEGSIFSRRLYNSLPISRGHFPLNNSQNAPKAHLSGWNMAVLHEFEVIQILPFILLYSVQYWVTLYGDMLRVIYSIRFDKTKINNMWPAVIIINENHMRHISRTHVIINIPEVESWQCYDSSEMIRFPQRNIVSCTLYMTLIKWKSINRTQSSLS